MMIKKYYIDVETYMLISRGIFAVRKIKDITSASVVELVKKSIVRDLDCDSKHSGFPLKVGHGGTLDSSATGVLAIGTCGGCKLLSKFLHGKKSYRVTGKLGEATNTYNDTGEVTHEAKSGHVTEKMLLSALPQFKGRILQRPPVFSALKRDGRRLADIARMLSFSIDICDLWSDLVIWPILFKDFPGTKSSLIKAGEHVEVLARPVHCYSIKCISFLPPYFTLSVTCGGGFYVRSLIHDLGISLGTYAHISDLTRTRQGPFGLDDCLEIDQLSLVNIVNAIRNANKKHHFFE